MSEQSTITRHAFEEQGYDCRHAPCKHNPQGNHGINGGRWIFGVSSGDKAVSLTVLTSFYPDTVPEAHRICGWPRKQDDITGELVFHRAIPTGERRCEFLAGRPCETESGGFTICDEFAPLLADTFEPQPEAVWKKLESLLAEWEAG